MGKRCVNHPDAPSVADCKVCSTSVCLMCVEEVGDHSYCGNTCAATHRQTTIRAATARVTRVQKQGCSTHADAPAVASCKVCQKPVCVLCVVDTADGEYCSTQCQQDLNAVSEWVTPATDSGVDAGAASTTDQILNLGNDSIFDMGGGPPPPPPALEEILEVPAAFAPEPEPPPPAPATRRTQAPPPAEMVACMVCNRPVERLSAIERSDGYLFCSFECSGAQMGVPPPDPEPAPAYEAPPGEPEPVPEEPAEAAPARGGRLYAVIVGIGVVLLIVVGLVVAWAFIAPPEGKPEGAVASKPKSEPAAAPKPPAAPIVELTPAGTPAARALKEAVNTPPPPTAIAAPVAPKPAPPPVPKPEPVVPKPDPSPPKPEPVAAPKPVPPPPQADPPARPKPAPVQEDPAQRAKRLLAEAGRILEETAPLFKDLVDGADPLPAGADARRSLAVQAQALRSRLSRARDLLTACRESDPLVLDRRVSTLGGMMESLADALRRLQ